MTEQEEFEFRRRFEVEAGQAEPRPKAPPAGIRGEGFDKAMNYSGRDAVSGAVRGAGSIGDTLLTPVDAGARAMGVQNDFVGRNDRGAAMDAGLQTMGADPNSTAFKTGKLGAEIAGTLGVGGALGKGVAVLPGAGQKAALLSEALRTSGMNLGGTTGSKMADMLVRMGAGAATGGASAGLVDHETAGTGALVGGALPPVMGAAGKAGEFVGNKMAKAYAEKLADFSRKSPKNDTVRESLEAGYTIPPSMVDPTFTNKMIESISGKQATQQIASTKNTNVTDKLVRKALGISDDAPLSSGALEDLRKTAGKAYAEVSSLSPQAAADLEALKTARNEAQGWFNAYNRSARPDDLAQAKTARALTEQLESALEAHAKTAGKDELIPALRDARKQIAKTYTVGRALNDATGTVDARVLARMFEKGKPLSDGLDTAGKFASGFPTIAKTPQQMGSPDTHNLKAIISMLMGGAGGAAAGPVGMVAGAAPFVAPPIARAAMFREGAQKALVKEAPQMSSAAQLAAALRNPELQMMLARSAPAISAQVP